VRDAISTVSASFRAPASRGFSFSTCSRLNGSPDGTRHVRRGRTRAGRRPRTGPAPPHRHSPRCPAIAETHEAGQHRLPLPSSRVRKAPSPRQRTLAKHPRSTGAGIAHVAFAVPRPSIGRPHNRCKPTSHGARVSSTTKPRHAADRHRAGGLSCDSLRSALLNQNPPFASEGTACRNRRRATPLISAQGFIRA